jgi:hypothetical protein
VVNSLPTYTQLYHGLTHTAPSLNNSMLLSLRISRSTDYQHKLHHTYTTMKLHPGTHCTIPMQHPSQDLIQITPCLHNNGTLARHSTAFAILGILTKNI